MRTTVRLAAAVVFLWLPVRLCGQAKPEQPKPKEISQNTELGGKNLAAWMSDLKSSDPSVREEAIRVVVYYPGPHKGDLITLLLDRCEDRDVSLRIRAVQAFTVLDSDKEEHKRIVRAMGSRLRNDDQEDVRFQAAFCLLRFGEEARGALDSLIYMSWNALSFETRRTCIQCLELCGRNAGKPPAPEPKVTLALLKSLGEKVGEGDRASQARREAAVALGSLGRSTDTTLHQRVMNALTAKLSDPDKTVVIWSLVSLMALDNPNKPSDNYVTLLKGHLKSKDIRERVQTIRALGLIGDNNPMILPTLIELLDDKNPVIVGNSILALAGIGPPAMKAVPKLEEIAAVKDQDPAVKAAAEMAVKIIKGIKDKDKDKK